MGQAWQGTQRHGTECRYHDTMELCILPPEQASDAVCVVDGKRPVVAVEIDGIATAICRDGGCLSAAWALVHGREMEPAAA